MRRQLQLGFELWHIDDDDIVDSDRECGIDKYVSTVECGDDGGIVEWIYGRQAGVRV